MFHEGLVNFHQPFENGGGRRDITTESVRATLARTAPLAKTIDDQSSRLRSWAEGRARNASVRREVIKMNRRGRTLSKHPESGLFELYTEHQK
jgi:hypothetical protein